MAIRVLPNTQPTPLERLVEDYLSNCRARGVAPRTDKQYTYSLRAVFLSWAEGEGITDLPDLDGRALDRYTSSLLARRNREGVAISKHSVHTYIRPLRLLLTWAAREGEEVKAKPQLPRRERPLRDVLSRAELEQLEHAVPNERDKLIIRIFADCGLRLEELTRLKASDLVRGGRQAHFRVHGKRDRIRDVPVPPNVLRRLDRLIASRPEDRSSDHIFIGLRRGRLGYFEALTVGGVYQVVKEAVARAGITKRVHPHLLRHSWMTEMLRCGMNPIQLSFIAGASTDVIAQHYAHLTKDDAYEAMLRALSTQAR